MYLVPTKTMLVDALRQTFDGDYVREWVRGLRVSIEFPEERQDYPSVWVDFEPIGDLEVVGIDHAEYALGGGGTARRYTRWRFQGYATYTAAALTSLERDRIYDELVRVFAFGSEHTSTQAFRRAIEDHPLIAANMDFGTIGQRGHAASPGTPWQTDEIIYEGTLSMNLIGEFINDSLTGDLVPIESIQVTPLRQGEPDPSGW